MPRRARVTIPGVAYHVVQRGNNRLPCFFSEPDYRFYLECLRAGAQRYRCAIHAYVLMTNHVHLLLSVDEPAGLSQLMRYVGSRYVQRINRVHERCGTLWESRFRSSIVQTEKHLMACYRYIELNPVRAGIVEHPADYPWSSCIGHVTGARKDLLKDHVVFLELGMSDTDRAAAYGDLLNEPLAHDLIERIRSSVYGGLALGEGTEPVSSIRAPSPSTAAAVP